MDTDLFSPADTAALLAIRAVTANRKATPVELEAMFDSSGLTRSAGSAEAAVGLLRATEG